MSANARIQKSYQVKGVDAKGRTFAFPVNAWDHADAVKKAKAKATGKVTSVVLTTPMKERTRQQKAAMAAYKKLKFL